MTRQRRSVRLGFSCHLGWAAVAALLTRADDILGVRTFRILTAKMNDRQALEPFHMAGGFDGLARVPAPANPAAVIRTGLERQARTAARSLEGLLKELEDWPKPRTAGILMGRGKPAPTLERTLASHTQIHIAEGNAVRDSIFKACTAHGIKAVGLDRRSLGDALLAHTGQDQATLLASLAVLKPDNAPAGGTESKARGHPESAGGWRQEEKICALTALLC